MCWLSKWLFFLEGNIVLFDVVHVFLHMPISTFFVVQSAHTRLPLFAVCFTIIANTPLPSVHFTHDVAHLFTHLSELLCVCVYVCIVSCHAKPERC